jgi:hypothetical protein
MKLVDLFVAVLGIGVFVPTLAPVKAHASPNDPALGGCVVREADGQTCKLSAHSSVVMPVVAMNLVTGNLAGGLDVVPMGACYGLTYKPGQWYASGVDYCFSARFRQDAPNQISPFALMLNVADYGAAGVGVTGTQDPAGMIWQWSMYFAPRIPLQ